MIFVVCMWFECDNFDVSPNMLFNLVYFTDQGRHIQ